MSELSKSEINTHPEFDLPLSQWDEVDEDGELAWFGPDGRPLAESELEVPEVDATGFQADDMELPPERIRFTTLVNIKVVGEQDYKEGVIVNLSTEGAACVCPASLEKDMRVWITFRLGLVDNPISLLCEVVWKRVTKRGESSFGFRFLELEGADKKRIEEVVRERSEGRAAEWSLPILPKVDVAPKLRVNPWVSAILGLVAGLSIALISAGISLPELTAAALPGMVSSQSNLTSEKERAEPEIGEMSVSALIDETRKTHPRTQLDKSALGDLPKAQGFADESSEVAQPTTTNEPNQASGMQSNDEAYATRLRGKYIIPLRPSDNLTLDLRTENPVGAIRTFWLSKPRRLVVDVPDNRSDFDRYNYIVDHPLAGKLRIGQHKDKVRFVVETSATTGKAFVKNGYLVVKLARR